MAVLLETHRAYEAHDTGPGHPERSVRLEAVLAGIQRADLSDAVVAVAPEPAPLAALERVHAGEYLEALQAFCRDGGGYLDADTHVGQASWDAAVLAAGAGLDAVARLEQGEADAAFCVVRPPGHHARPAQAMGFCLLNNVAVTAAELASRGERVLVVDWDAHHGNGTQETFYGDPRVLYVSLHQFPLYPGTGRLDETGAGAGVGTTVNLPLPPGTAGDVYRAAFDRVVVPVAERFAPAWLLISAGFDAHRADPLTAMALTAGDFADLTAQVLPLVGRGRTISFLEGGYDLDALAASTGAFVAALVGESYRPEAATAGGPGSDVVDAAAKLHGIE